MSFLLLAEVRATDVWDAGELIAVAVVIIITAAAMAIVRVRRRR